MADQRETPEAADDDRARHAAQHPVEEAFSQPEPTPSGRSGWSVPVVLAVIVALVVLVWAFL